MKVGRIFYFDASHHIPKYKGKCEQIHGHTYRLEVMAEDEVKKDGMVMDFTEIKDIINREVVDVLDHRNLNEVLDNPTAENITEWIWNALEKKLPLKSVKLWEGRDSWVEKTNGQ